MLHCTTFFATCLAISAEAGLYFFKWRVSIILLAARQVARKMFRCAMARKYIAVLGQSLRKVEPDSTSCNAS